MNTEHKVEQKTKKEIRKVIYGITDRRFDPWWQKLNDFLIDHSPVKQKEKSIFFNSLQLLVSSGVRIVKALEILAERQRNLRFRRILDTIIYDMLEKGFSFSKALEKYPTIFKKPEIKIIYAGEVSGQVEQNLGSVAKQISKNIEIAIRIKSAMMYPITVISAIIIATGIIMVFVVPKFMVLFAEFPASELPISTRILMGVSNFVQQFWWFIITLSIGGWFIFQNWKRTETGKRQWDGFILKLPKIKNIIRNIQTIQISSNFSTLMAAGISVDKALHILGEIVSNSVMTDAIWEVKRKTIAGTELHTSFKEDPLFDPVLGEVIEIGEKGGKIPSILEKTATQYQIEVDAQLKNINTIIEPIILVLMGGAVVFMALAIMTPIFKLQELFTSS